MHYDRQSAQELASQQSLLQALVWIVILLLFAFVLAVMARQNDAKKELERLREDTDLMHRRVAACEETRDELTDLQKRVTGVEAQFWE